MTWIESGVTYIGNFVRGIMSDGMLKDLIVDGVIGGVGGVIVFLPNILILYFCISLMEDSGYMARAAFIMDKIMHKMGLHGKSFIPLLMGFGCNVPAVMATRTIDVVQCTFAHILGFGRRFLSSLCRFGTFQYLLGGYLPGSGNCPNLQPFFG